MARASSTTARNMLLALGVLLLVAQVPPHRLLQLAVPLYVVGVALLIVTALPGVGITKKGATRWLDVGMVIQPSEIMKIAMPLMLAWWFQRREGQLRALDFVVAALLLLLPVGLIMKQPDLGTSLLVLFAGPVRDLLRRAVLEADRAGAGAGRGRPSWPSSSAPMPSAPKACTGRCSRSTSATACAPCSTRPTTRWARASTSSRGRSPSAPAASPARA